MNHVTQGGKHFDAGACHVNMPLCVVCTGPLWGVLFERLAHLALQRGGTFMCRDLETGEAEEVTLSSNPQVLAFSQLAEVSTLPDGGYAKPLSRTFASVDALIKVMFRGSGCVLRVSIALCACCSGYHRQGANCVAFMLLAARQAVPDVSGQPPPCQAGWAEHSD
jgi:hypothetical protein